jgi:hypothetical protein
MAALFGTAAMAGPVAALVWPDAVKWVAVVGYEIALLLGGFFGGVLSELRKRWQARTVERVDQALNRRFARFRRRYRLKMQSSLRWVDLKGLTTLGSTTPDLDDVFVHVSLDYSSPHDVPAGLVGGLRPDAGDRLPIEFFLSKKGPMILAVLGAPGSGKTTLLRHTARHMFDQKRRRIPILLYLRDHVSAIAKDHSLPSLVRHMLIEQGELEPDGWFEQKLRRGRCVVLLDGLDEVGRQADRRRVADWVERQIQRYPKNTYVLTSRPHGYRSAPVAGAAVLQVRSFTEDQVQRFVHKWYFAVERRSRSGTDEEVTPVAESLAEDLQRRLHNAPALADLTVNPLLLTMIANVHKHRGALPGTRAELYSEICEVMLWRRQDVKKLANILNRDKKEGLLRVLAFKMMERRVRDLETHEILRYFDDTLSRFSRGAVTAEDFLADVGSNGLLVERENGLYAFAHHTFQEFLAATYIKEKGNIEVLAANVDDVWWRETTLLYAAKSDTDGIVTACLANGSVTALSLAFACDDQEGGDLAQVLRERLNSLLTGPLVNETDPDLRMLASTVITTRHLQEVVRTTRGTRICPRPITNRLYHLYRQDVPGPLPDGPGVFKQDDRPVAGVWKKDVAEFIRWANQRTGTAQKYRQPAESELSDPTIRQALAGVQNSVWVHDGDTSSTLWTTLVTENPRTVSRDLLAEHIGEDLRLLVNSQDSMRQHRLILNAGQACDLLAQIVILDGLPKDTEPSNRYGIALGNAMTAATAHSSLNEHTENPWLLKFIMEFIDSVDLGRTRSTVDLDELANITRKLRKSNEDVVRKSKPSPQWLTTVTTHFCDAVLPIFTRQHQLNSAAATALRMTAWCLAVEASRKHKQPVSDSFRQAAAGLTLMGRRATGRSPVNETIIVAIE